MLQADRPTRLVALGVSALAGYVDAIGFIELGGFFVSFMSGNSTKLAIGLATDRAQAAVAAALVAGFVAGVMLGSLVGQASRPHRASAVIALTAALLILAVGLNAAALPSLGVWAMVLAMGAVNSVFERDGEVRIGLTYMTGTLVKIGQRLAGALTGGDPLAWAPYLLQWLCLVAGAVAGATAYARFGPPALWGAVAVAIICAVGARTIRDA